jgi:hypothetical protein
MLIRLFLWSGSANGMSINLLGLEEGFDIPLAVLNVVKGGLLHCIIWDTADSKHA